MNTGNIYNLSVEKMVCLIQKKKTLHKKTILDSRPKTIIPKSVFFYDPFLEIFKNSIFLFQKYFIPQKSTS